LHRDEPALQNINLKISEGEFIALLGPLGAGKTTLLYSLNGLVPHTIPGKLEGDVIVDGKNTKDYLTSEMVSSVGMVLDDPVTQVFNLTVRDDVEFGPLNLGRSPTEATESADESLSCCRLKGLELRHPRELSGGQQQALSIAGVLAMRPKILALDEPISMLDPVGKSMVLEAVRDLNKRYGVACVISESVADLEDVLSMVYRVIVMDKGLVLRDGEPREIARDKLLEEIGVGLPQVTEVFMKLRERVPSIEVPADLGDAERLIRENVKRGRLRSRHASIVCEPRVFSSAPFIDVEDLVYAYPNGVRALNQVKFKLWKGEFVGIIGQNGSGKSTLAQCITGVFKASNKEAMISVGGANVAKSRLRDIITKVNYVFQNPDSMLFSTNVLDEVSFGPKMLEFAPEETSKMVEEALEFLRLKEYKRTLIIDLPHFVRTLVALASVLVLKPEVIIIDEPTGGLDRKESVRLLTYLKRLRDEGLTFIIITHDMRLISEFCERVVVMSEGKIILDGPAAMVFSEREALRRASIKPPQVTQLAHALSDMGFNPLTLSVEDFLRQIEIVGGSKVA
jgi:energy-coupling factor transport system ATP-binding protein